MVRAVRAKAMATKRGMATHGNTTSKGYGKEGDRRLTAAKMGTAQRTRMLALRLERGG
jgi:hypothetical protein